MPSPTAQPSRPLYRKNVPASERPGHLRNLASTAFRERSEERAKLRAILREDKVDVYDITPLALAQEKARIWRTVRARAAGSPEMGRHAQGSVFEPDDDRLMGEVLNMRAELRDPCACGSEYEEQEAARLFLVFTEFIELPEEEPQ